MEDSVTKPIIPEPDVDTERTPAAYAKAARLVAQAREQALCVSKPLTMPWWR